MITKDLRETMRLIESSDYFWLGLTLSAYLLGLVLNRRLKNPPDQPPPGRDLISDSHPVPFGN